MMFIIHKLIQLIEQNITKGIMQLMWLCTWFGGYSQIFAILRQLVLPQYSFILVPCKLRKFWNHYVFWLERLSQTLHHQTANFTVLLHKVLNHFILPKIHLTEEEESILYLMCPICWKQQGIVLKIHAGTGTQKICMYVLVCFFFKYFFISYWHGFIGKIWKYF